MSLTLYTPTRADLRARVRVFIDESVQANFMDTDINYALNQAQDEVVLDLAQVAENYFISTTPTVITLQSATQYYPLAADFLKMSRLEDVTTGLPIPLKPFNDDNSYLYGSNPILAPLQCAVSTAFILGNSLGFRPVPSSAGQQVQYWYVPRAPYMMADTDVSIIPGYYLDLLAIRAAIDMFIKDTDNSAALERRYAERKEQLTLTARDRQQQNPREVRRTDNHGINGLI